MTKTCPCGAPIPVKTGPGRPPTYCSPSCKPLPELRGQRCAMSVRTCIYCDELYVARVGPARESRSCEKSDCKRLLKNAQQRAWSQAFREKHGVTYSRMHHADQRHVDKLRREAKLAEGWERFRREDVYDRDGWICQLCGEPVDPELKWPHPGSRSLDHKIPVAKGGKHTMSNSQLAHLGCNCAKQDREEAEDGSPRNEAQTSRSATEPEPVLGRLD